jgi:hypothetical protein
VIALAITSSCFAEVVVPREVLEHTMVVCSSDDVDSGFMVLEPGFVAVPSEQWLVVEEVEGLLVKRGIKCAWSAPPGEYGVFHFNRTSPVPQVFSVKIIMDGPPPPPPDPALLSMEDVSSTEGEQAIVRVTVQKPKDQEITANIRATDDSAKAGQDYRLVTNAISIPANATQTEFPIILIDNDERDGNRSFRVGLDVTAGPGRFVGPDAVVTIEDDDGQPPGSRWVLLVHETGDMTPALGNLKLALRAEEDRALKDHKLMMVDDDCNNEKGDRVEAMAPYVARAKEKGIPRLFICIDNTDSAEILYDGPLPQSADEILQLVKEYGG